ncbi:imprinted and ancient [Pyrrhoderma noxium]|uniref:Imprinted and ancient n=1 Tax=Pyrrhoderma noxium TaxID=2282107 RepID=A0A286UI93_9AGAM|nr:imprinted and ancient [Pyrrhoderma noxium]
MLLCTNRIFVQRHLTTRPLYLLTRAKSRLAAIKNAPQNTLPDGVVIHVSESLSDRRSVFVGRACRVTDPSAVSSIISYLMTDKRIAKASHPTIYAWRCIVDEKIKQGNDDCGEASAGGKLSDLLELLNVNDILVVVTRNLGDHK